MFHRKANQVSALNSQLDRSTQQYNEVEPYVPLAKALGKSVAQMVAGQPGGDVLGVDMDNVYQETIRKVGVDMVLRAWEALPPAEFLERFQDTKDSALSEALQDIAHTRQLEHARNRRLENLKFEARSKGRVPLRLVEAGELLKVGLFDSNFPHNAYINSPYQTGEIELRLIDPEVGDCIIINSDNELYDFWDNSITDNFAAGSRGHVGTLSTISHEFHNGRHEGLVECEPEISIRSPLGLMPKGPSNAVKTNSLVGFVETRDGHVLMDGI